MSDSIPQHGTRDLSCAGNSLQGVSLPSKLEAGSRESSLPKREVDGEIHEPPFAALFTFIQGENSSF